MKDIKKVVSTRLSINEIAKARDGLICAGITPDQCASISQILRLTFYYGISFLSEFPDEPSSQESISLIKQKMNIAKKDSDTISLQDILK